MTDKEVAAALHLDDDDDLLQIAADNDIAPPAAPDSSPETIDDRGQSPGQS